MNLERNTLKNLRAMCSRELDLFRGYSSLCKNDLVTFMEEKINAQQYIALESDSDDSTDTEYEYDDIPNAQEETLEIYEDMGITTPETSFNSPPISTRLGPIPFPDLPPVSPPTTPPPPHQLSVIQLRDIDHEIECSVFDRFTESEKTHMEYLNSGQWVSMGEVDDMSSRELVEWHLQNIMEDHGYIYNMIAGDAMRHPDITDLTEFVSEAMVTFLYLEVKEKCFDYDDDSFDNGPECPVCYNSRPGMMVETSCKHVLCFPCLNETWKAKCGEDVWFDKTCPMCRTEVKTMTFV